MLNLTFYTPKEFASKIFHGQTVVYLSNSAFYGTSELRQGDVEFFWEVLDEDGIPKGASICFDKETESSYTVGSKITHENETHELKWMINGVESEGINFLMDSDEYFDAIDNA